MKRAALLKGYLFIIAASVIYGFMPLGTKLIYADGVDALTLAFLRNALALPALWLMTRLRHQSLRAGRRALGAMCLLGLMGCVLTPLLLFSSYQYLPSGAATVFHFIYPSAVVLVSLLLGGKVTKTALVGVLLFSCGISLFFDVRGAVISVKGAALALSSGVTYAGYVVLLSRFRHKEVSGFALSFYVSLFSAASLGTVCMVKGGSVFPSSWWTWLFCALFAVVLSVGAVVLFQQGTMLAGGQRAAILSTFEPVVSIFAGILFLQESITVREILGSAIVISASVVIAAADLTGREPPSDDNGLPVTPKNKR